MTDTYEEAIGKGGGNAARGETDDEVRAGQVLAHTDTLYTRQHALVAYGCLVYAHSAQRVYGCPVYAQSMLWLYTDALYTRIRMP